LDLESLKDRNLGQQLQTAGVRLRVREMSLPSSAEKTEVGSYFVSNYPPYSFWKPEHVPAAREALERPGRLDVPLGLYLHIPFCRKRCKFCYFRVYTDKNSREVERYVAALARELELYRELPGIAGRPLRFVYFGGGTPSYLSAAQLRSLVERLRRSVSWDRAEEVTFECEPGTLSEQKLEAIREIGVTRLSLGVESLSDEVLEENGRAHRSEECFRAYEWARRQGFAAINIDLIAGMVGETWESWQDAVTRVLALGPDSITVYQLELPYNTVYSREGVAGTALVPDWATKRAWVDWAFDASAVAGYEISSAYTVVRRRAPATTQAGAAAQAGRGAHGDASARPDGVGFAYRDLLWHGADLIGAGVASFSHFGGVHYQNLDRFEDYIGAVEAGSLPLARALPLSARESLVRELILQMKLGRIDAHYFRRKFSADVLVDFGEVWARYERDGLLRVDGDRVWVTRQGLLRVDGLLEAFFAPEHRNAR
jgi:oxygen-independent coproporphyrinogen-3 oxidase